MRDTEAVGWIMPAGIASCVCTDWVILFFGPGGNYTIMQKRISPILHIEQAVNLYLSLKS